MEKTANEYLGAITGDTTENYFTPIWREVCAKITPRSVLDVGCGTGIFSAALKQTTGCSLIGVDSSPYAVEQSRAIGFDEVFIVGDVCSEPLPFDANRFDLVFCKDVIEHLLDPEYLVREMYRVIAHDGYLLVHIPNQFSLYGRIRFLWTNNIDSFHYFPNVERWDYPHIRFFTYEDFRKLLQRCGFVVVSDFSRYFFSSPFQRFIPWKQHVAKALTRWSPSQFAEGFTLLVQKLGAPAEGFREIRREHPYDGEKK